MQPQPVVEVHDEATAPEYHPNANRIKQGASFALEASIEIVARRYCGIHCTQSQKSPKPEAANVDIHGVMGEGQTYMDALLGTGKNPSDEYKWISLGQRLAKKLPAENFHFACVQSCSCQGDLAIFASYFSTLGRFLTLFDQTGAFLCIL